MGVGGAERWDSIHFPQARAGVGGAGANWGERRSARKDAPPLPAAQAQPAEQGDNGIDT